MGRSTGRAARGPRSRRVAPGRQSDRRVAAALERLDEASHGAAQPTNQYPPLGPVYPSTSTGRRRALAAWVADRDNPRTARVAVNHVWMRHFHQPLVQTVTDFGGRAASPTHPELLDWLAAELMDHGWSLKHLHRLIVTSNAYRMQSLTGPAGSRETRLDPDNRWLWRMNARRMEAEVVRDALLEISGQLDRTIGGPDLDESLGEDLPRRSLYFRVTPDSAMPWLATFDFASPNECYRRTESVVPQQALALKNSRLALTAARQLARALDGEHAGDDAFIRAAFLRVVNRPPTVEEQRACARFLEEHARLVAGGRRTPFPAAAGAALTPADAPPLRARENLVHVLINHNEFITIR